MDKNSAYYKDIESFTFTKDTSDEMIFDMCENMGVPEKEAHILISIRDKHTN